MLDNLFALFIAAPKSLPPKASSNTLTFKLLALIYSERNIGTPDAGRGLGDSKTLRDVVQRISRARNRAENFAIFLNSTSWMVRLLIFTFIPWTIDLLT